MQVVDVLGNWRRGAVLADLNAKMAEAVAAAKATGKKASLTLKIELTPDDADRTQMKLDASVCAKIPVAKLPTAVLFADDAGVLHLTDPRQLEMQIEKDEATGTESLAARRLSTAV